MLNGPGKYDALCAELCDSTKATGAFVLIIDGYRGSGLAIKMLFEDLIFMPAALADLARHIRLKKSTYSEVGKYDTHCSEIVAKAKAKGAFIIVRNGALGSDLSIQMPPDDLARLPDVLERVAGHMRVDIANAISPGTGTTQ